MKHLGPDVPNYLSKVYLILWYFFWKLSHVLLHTSPLWVVVKREALFEIHTCFDIYSDNNLKFTCVLCRLQLTTTIRFFVPDVFVTQFFYCKRVEKTKSSSFEFFKHSWNFTLFCPGQPQCPSMVQITESHRGFLQSVIFIVTKCKISAIV